MTRSEFVASLFIEGADDNTPVLVQIGENAPTTTRHRISTRIVQEHTVIYVGQFGSTQFATRAEFIAEIEKYGNDASTVFLASGDTQREGDGSIATTYIPGTGIVIFGGNLPTLNT